MATYSFDVFDTCVSRIHAHPRDLFFALGMRIAPPGLSSREAHRFARRFQRRRIAAEKQAYREVRPHECATLREIYARLARQPGLDLSVEQLMAAEIELERQAIYPVPTVVARIEALRREGHRIIFVSDMYLPRSVLEPLLLELGIMRPGEPLYVSCDSRLTKHTGNLFAHVLEQERLEPDQMHHLGDNPRADVRMARDRGIAASHFAAGELNRHERTMAGRRLPRPPSQSFLPALSRRTRLAGAFEGEDHPLDGAIFGTIAPLLVAYVDWVLQDAAAKGLDRLYFVARDGEVLYRVAQALRPDGHGPALHYLYGSRRAWLAPSIAPVDPEWQRLLLTPGQSNSPRDVLARTGLDEAAQQAVFHAVGLGSASQAGPLGPAGAARFLARVLASEGATRLLFEHATRKAGAALAYFEQEGLLRDGRWALVDAGWSLNCQAALKRILARRVPDIVPCGYYLALARDHLDVRRAGPAHAFVPQPGSIFSRRRVVVEHCFTPATHATTRDYRIEGGLALPDFGSELRQPAELAYARRVQDAACTLATLLAREGGLLGEFRSHRAGIIRHAERLLACPMREDAALLAPFATNADLRHTRAFVRPLCRPLGLADVRDLARTALFPARQRQAPSYLWLEGSRALSPWYVRLPVSAMLGVDALRHRAGSAP